MDRCRCPRDSSCRGHSRDPGHRAFDRTTIMRCLMKNRGRRMKTKNPTNLHTDDRSNCADRVIQDKLACRQGGKILSGFRAPIEPEALHILTRTSRQFFEYCSLLRPVRSASVQQAPVAAEDRDLWFGFINLRHLHGHSVIFITYEISDRLRMTSPNNTFHI